MVYGEFRQATIGHFQAESSEKTHHNAYSGLINTLCSMIFGACPDFRLLSQPLGAASCPLGRSRSFSRSPNCRPRRLAHSISPQPWLVNTRGLVAPNLVIPLGDLALGGHDRRRRSASLSSIVGCPVPLQRGLERASLGNASGRTEHQFRGTRVPPAAVGRSAVELLANGLPEPFAARLDPTLDRQSNADDLLGLRRWIAGPPGLDDRSSERRNQQWLPTALVSNGDSEDEATALAPMTSGLRERGIRSIPPYRTRLPN